MNTKTVLYDEVLPRVVAKGYTQQQLDNCLDEYEQLNVWQLGHNRAQIVFTS
jgi:DNA replication licensing factor MCM7